MYAFVVRVALLFFILIGVGTAQTNDIERGLSCQCGCGMTVATCVGAMDCSAASKIDSEVRSLVKQGIAKDQIYAFLVKTHGEQILAAPTKRGFNLMAWVLPFIVIIASGIILYLLLKRWDRNKQVNSKPSREQKLDPDYEKQLDEELKEYESWS
ncbi:MAG: hypothetical protein GWP06_01945 [Actinobacteria bacterium]|nr:hypothetical protein [Actinomycetota bacterium]